MKQAPGLSCSGSGVVVSAGTCESNNTEQWSEPSSPVHSEPDESCIPPVVSYAYPEGGLSAWLVVLGAWAAMVVGLGLVNTVGSLQAYLSSHQLKDYSEGSVSWIFSIYVFLVFFCGLQIGPIFDAKGPRWLIGAGTILTVAGTFALAECTKYWHFILDFSILLGIGSSLLFTPAIAVVSHYFSSRRSFATGIAATGGACGGIIFPLALQSLFPKVGYQWSMRILAFLFLSLLALSNLLIKGRIPPKRGSRASSMLPDLKIFLDKDGSMALMTAGTFFMEFGLFVPVTYLTSYCLDNGVDPAFSYQVIAILNAASAFGRWLPGMAADKVGRINTMIAMLLLCLIATLAFWLPAATNEDTVIPLVVIYCIIFGFASGSNISLTPTCVGQLCDTSEYGRYYATCYTLVSFACLTGIPIGGSLIQAAGGEYWGLIVFTGCSYFLSTACFLAVKVIKCGWNPKVAW